MIGEDRRIKSQELEEEGQRLREQVLARLDLSRELSDEEVQEIIDDVVMESSRESHAGLAEKKQLRKMLFDTMRRMDILQELMDDPKVTEIMINGPDHIFVERKGKLTKWDKRFSSKQKLEDMVQQIVSFSNRAVSKAHPIADARLPDGARVNVVLDPVALDGPVVTIRRFPRQPIDMEQLIEWGSVTAEAAGFLREAVSSGKNLFISGGTGSGKTTFLNALSQYIPEQERIITIEDNAELQIRHIPNLVRLEARDANTEGTGEITIRDLIRTALRMRPSRIVVGEVRGSEAVDMLQAMNTGHDGSLSTGHANSTGDMLNRLEMMVLMGMDIPLDAIRRQIASALDLLVHLGRMPDGSRRVLEITEVVGYEQGNILLRPVFLYEELPDEAGTLRRCAKD
ncbi:MAG: CpaF family protein [Lachnospiraceae bacterium]|nr:CpaF family protein [Lachnospiraceae bacterium]